MTDKSKAFDNKQFWSVELMFNRFGIPKKFSNFYLKYISNCDSYVKTGYGLTEKIILKNSLKQYMP